jgi:hypothetical protein
VLIIDVFLSYLIYYFVSKVWEKLCPLTMSLLAWLLKSNLFCSGSVIRFVIGLGFMFIIVRASLLLSRDATGCTFQELDSRCDIRVGYEIFYW